MNGEGEKPGLRATKESLERRLYESGGPKAVKEYQKEIRDALRSVDRQKNEGK